MHLLCSPGCRFSPVCYERDIMRSFSNDKQTDIIDSFNTTSRYLDDISNISNVYLTIC